jgi:ABC-type cobalamin transport system permease subunit
MLGWIPFLEPMNALQPWWYLLLVPMAFGISVIYKALHEDNLMKYWRSVTVMATQIVLGISLLAVAIGLFIQLVIPAITQP